MKVIKKSKKIFSSWQLIFLIARLFDRKDNHKINYKVENTY